MALQSLYASTADTEEERLEREKEYFEMLKDQTEVYSNWTELFAKLIEYASSFMDVIGNTTKTNLANLWFGSFKTELDDMYNTWQTLQTDINTYRDYQKDETAGSEEYNKLQAKIDARIASQEKLKASMESILGSINSAFNISFVYTDKTLTDNG